MRTSLTVMGQYAKAYWPIVVMALAMLIIAKSLTIFIPESPYVTNSEFGLVTFKRMNVIIVAMIGGWNVTAIVAYPLAMLFIPHGSNEEPTVMRVTTAQAMNVMSVWTAINAIAYVSSYWALLMAAAGMAGVQP